MYAYVYRCVYIYMYIVVYIYTYIYIQMAHMHRLAAKHGLARCSQLLPVSRDGSRKEGMSEGGRKGGADGQLKAAEI